MGSPSVIQARPSGLNEVGTLPSVKGLSVRECGVGPLRQTVLTFENVPFSLSDTNAYGSLKVYTFPAGRIHAKATASLTATTKSTLASTLNASSTCSWGLGTAAASSATLATTMMNYLPGSGESVKTFTSSATIDVAGSAMTGFQAAVSAAFLSGLVDGTSTAAPVYLNIAVPTATDIDGDATLAINGTVTITWVNEGDF